MPAACCSKPDASNNCNGTSKATASTYEVVKDYYGKVLSNTKDLKTSACTASGRPHPRIIKLMQSIPHEVIEKFYGCGAPLPLGIQGLRVLDLGSGSGRDAYVCAALVGESGQVTGIDMTEEQIQVSAVSQFGLWCGIILYTYQHKDHVLQVSEQHAEAYRKALGYRKLNLHFVKGHIEYLDKANIANESVDIVISNCVVNLSPDKLRVIQEAYRVLAPGGEFYFSDVYCDRRLPQHVKDHQVDILASIHQMSCVTYRCWQYLSAVCKEVLLPVTGSTTLRQRLVGTEDAAAAIDLFCLLCIALTLKGNAAHFRFAMTHFSSAISCFPVCSF